MIQNASAPNHDPPRFREAFERLLPELRAVPDNELQTLHLGIEDLVTTVIGAWPQIRKQRPKLALLPGFDLERFDRLESYALALGHAQTTYRTAAHPQRLPAALAAQGVALRRILLAEASTLVARGHLGSCALADLRGVNGYRNIACDLLVLANLLRAHLRSAASRVGFDQAELDQAESLSDCLLTSVGRKQMTVSIPAQVARDRQAAFSLLVNAYNEVRVSIGFLLLKNHARVAARTTITTDELDEAENLADRLVTAVGEREQIPSVSPEAVRDRQAAFTLLVTTYDEVKAAIAFVRRKQGDADELAPSLYQGRRASKKAPAEPEPAPVATPTSASEPVAKPVAASEAKPATHGNGPYAE